MEPPRVRLSLDAWGTLLLAVAAFIGFHVWKQPDFSNAPILGVIYSLFWAVVFTGLGWFYYGLLRTTISEAGVTCFSLSGPVQIQWPEVTRVELLKSGSLALVTTTQRRVIPLACFAGREQLGEFILTRAQEAGADIDKES